MSDLLSELQKQPERDLEAKLRRAEKALKDEQAKRKSLEKILDEAHERLEKATRLKFGVKTPKKAVPKGSYLRTIITDTHGSRVDEQAIAAFLNDLPAIKPRQHLHLGDALECGGFLAEHMTLGYVAETDTQGFEADIAAANWLLDEVARRAPKAELHQLEGNHENRIERWCVTQSLRNNADAKYLLKLHGPANVMNLEKRGVHWWSADKFHMDLAVRGAIRLGPAHFTHGTAPGRANTGPNATRNLIRQFGTNIIHGHTHRADSLVDRNVKSGTIIGACPGFMAKLQPYWMHGMLTGWSHGYAIQLVMPNEDFLHINIPVIDGESYLLPLIERLI